MPGGFNFEDIILNINMKCNFLRQLEKILPEWKVKDLGTMIQL